jgi:hypothetical protein
MRPAVPGGAMTRALRLLATLAAISGLLACATASTTLSMKWMDPEAAGTHFTKVITVAVSPDAKWREIVEDEMSLLVKNALPGYSVIPEDQVRNVERSKSLIKSGGFDGAIVLRMVGTEEESTRVVDTAPAAWGGYYGSMWGYWGYAWPAVYQTGYLVTDKYQVVEVLVYRVSDQKLLWGGRTRSLDPGSTRKMAGEIFKECRDAMVKQGLVPKK